MANPAQVEILRQGSKSWNSWLIKNQGISFDGGMPPVSKALKGSQGIEELAKALVDMGGVINPGVKINLSDADFEGADLPNVNLSDAILERIIFRNANLQLAFLSNTNLKGANMAFAQLQGASLSDANLSAAILSGAQLQGAFLDGVILENTDIRGCVIDAGTVQRSFWSKQNLEFWLSRGGRINEGSADRTWTSGEVFTVFISYGEPDVEFAAKLQDGLAAKDVKTWLFANDAVPGDPIHRVMRSGVDNYDRMILICSESSLCRSGVLNEIELCLTREAREGGANILIPVALDDQVYRGGWAPDSRPDFEKALLDRVVADFRGVESDERKFREGLGKLMTALQRKRRKQ